MSMFQDPGRSCFKPLETIFVQMSYGACAIRLLLTAKLPYLLCESAEAYPDGLPPG